MGPDKSRQRLYASVLILGACVLLFRTVMMISQGLLDVLVLWVSLLLIVELLIDLAWLLSSINWWISKDTNKASLPLRLASTAIILHAVRVLIFVLGRVGPWMDFDVRPEHRLLHYTRWTWAGVKLAAILSFLGVIGVLIVWHFIRRARRKAIGDRSL